MTWLTKLFQSVIAQWRHNEALRTTYLHRPDLLKERVLTTEEKKMLADIKAELD